MVKVVCTALGLAFATEQLGRKWSLLIGGAGQAFAMYSIGIQGAVAPKGLTPSSYYAIVCVYIFVSDHSTTFTSDLVWTYRPFDMLRKQYPSMILNAPLQIILLLELTLDPKLTSKHSRSSSTPSAGVPSPSS